ncbi:alpha-1-antitrypsin-like protein CM55-MM [Lampris incognitus]|uniref:alpha-1-antitrypsin-like protein CM55-MM n=1 Tax=Lampris incognitus TaxID=2546036 RepID=UPI0024B56356|nr:alpha-1-antitrypsin-like protein CM55-MM [Lampris incognitus]
MMRAALSVWVLSAVVCLGSGDAAEGRARRSGPEQQLTEPDGHSARLSQVSSASNAFSFRLYKTLAAQPDSKDNIFFSPISVTVALAALSVGARGETHQQLFSSLGLNSSLLTQAEVDRAFQTLLTRSDNTSQDLNAGTAVFVHDSFKPQPEFLHILKRSYQVDGFTVDFTRTAETTDTINKYVEEKTNGKIDKLVEDLDPSTLMYLLSYIYYKGQWETQFNPTDTKEEMFNVDEQNKVAVQMMKLKKIFRVYHDHEAAVSVLHLPLNNSNSMLLILPDKNLMKLEEAFCLKHITKWLKWMKPRLYTIFLPKLSIKTTYSLKEVLSGMGMQDIFGFEADFSGISDRQRLAVSEIAHQATLDLDEVGATAAAGTGIAIVPLSSQMVPVLRFDRPFVVLITDPATETILFMGKIVNPNI